ncbi:LytTR family DNA-binding domain-containing protein [Parablautia intestinalis]|jgi:DNA-binding LytR/AlgR family response regulator|uniref:LytTR family DNA-binding domain-containing protein n=1 Tax=Parablautia intestinalis TaxID=2320100 RepID=UPI00256EECB8|nr:LytTR family DNA-binding domain-containing protein [Parablautia intestinalis]MCI8615381.1 LytTR family transcriptional regulator [Lachnospiraceae bacterium]
MKLTMERIVKGEDEVIIRYHEMNKQLETIAGMVQGIGQKICAASDGQTLLLSPEDILYLESVDGVTYAYLEERVLKVQMSLFELAMAYGSRGFLRCSKSMVLNIYKINFLKSESGSRIRATMENGEQVMISRKYAKELRQRLKGGVKEDEE